MPSLKNTAPIFLEILLIECCTVLVEPSMTSSLSSVALVQGKMVLGRRLDTELYKLFWFYSISVAISSQTYKQVSDTSQRSNSEALQVSDDDQR